MKIKLSNGHVASRGDIIALQLKIGEQLDSEFLKFIALNDGAIPANNTFKCGPANDAGVNGFIPVKEIIREMSLIDNLPAKSFPIAWASCGNYVLINQSEGRAVYFWDHELTENEKCFKLANNFNSFIQLLMPFDINSVQLKPGQVQNVWIDPDFLKSQQ